MWTGLVVMAVVSGPGRAAERGVEVRRAVALTVRLGEPVVRDAAGMGGSPEREGSADGDRDDLPEATTAEGEDEPDGVAAEVGPTDLRTSKRVGLWLESGVLYDDNIFLNASDPEADLLWRVGAEVRLNFGDVVDRDETYLVARYRPDAYFFLENPEEDTLDHEAELLIRRKFARLAIDGSGRYQRTSGSTVELGDRVERDVASARGGLTYAVGAKTSLASSVRWDGTAYREGGYSDYREWAHESFIDYQATEKFRLGLGGGYGRLEVDDGSEAQDFQRALARFSHDATGTLTLSGRVGAEFRQTEVGDTTTPVFGLDATHALTAKTQGRLQAVREVAASGSLEGQNYTRTGLVMGVTHRVNDRVSLSVDGGWERYDYEAATRAALTLDDREDTTVFVRPGFSYSFGDRWRAEAWYQWRSNDSSAQDQTYEVKQMGLNMRFTF
ncbi:MAG: outer membrane beta-barrel protein [Verrucomicrobiales bacterium]